MQEFRGKVIFKPSGEKVIKVEDLSKNQKLFDLNDEFQIFQGDENVYDLKDGIEVFFSLQKKIYSDKTNLVAKILRIYVKDWNQILKDFIDQNHNHSLSEYQEYLKNKYQVPQTKVN